MNKPVAWTLAAALAAGSATAQSLTDAAAREKRRREAVHAAEWQEFRNSGGDFKVLFPYAPLRKREHIPSLPTLMETFAATKDKHVYLVRVGELPVEAPQQALDQMHDGFRAGILKEVSEGQIEDEQKITLGRRAGRGYRIRAKAPNGEEVAMSVRVFISERKMFMVMAAWPRDNQDNVTADRFFASFVILP